MEQSKTEYDYQKIPSGKVKMVKHLQYYAEEVSGKVVTGQLYLDRWENYRYCYDKWGNIIERAWYESEDNPFESHQYKYDSHHNLIAESWHDADGDLEAQLKYRYDVNGNEIKQSLYDSDGKIVRVSTKQYNSEGDITEYVRYNSDGDIEEKWKYEYEYDEKGNKVQESKYDSNGLLYMDWAYFFDNEGKKTECLERTNCIAFGIVTPRWVHRREVYEYDRLGNLLNSIKYQDGVVIKKKQYDTSGNIVEESWYWSDGELGGRGKYQYDSNGNLVHLEKYDEWDHLHWKRNLMYNNHGDKVKVVTYNFKGELESSDKYEYKYDQTGNWIEQVEYGKGNKPRMITIREIEYW